MARRILIINRSKTVKPSFILVWQSWYVASLALNVLALHCDMLFTVNTLKSYLKVL